MYAVFGLFYFWKYLRKKEGWANFICFSAPLIISVLLWCSFHLVTVNKFSMTSLIGTNLTTHSGSFFEKASDEHAYFRDIYLKYREPHIKKTGSHIMTILDGAEAEMRIEKNLTPMQLSSILTKISLELFVDHPLLYLKSYTKSWKSFWGSNQKVVGLHLIKNETLKSYMASKAPFYLIRAFWVCFLLSFLYLVFYQKMKDLFLISLGVILFFQCTFLSIITIGSGPRYASCYYGIAIVVVFSVVGQIFFGGPQDTKESTQ